MTVVGAARRKVWDVSYVHSTVPRSDVPSQIAASAVELADFYPQCYALIGERNANSGSGSGGDSTLAVPIRLDVLAFVAEHYDDGEGVSRPGITLTVMDSEQRARMALGRDVFLRRRPAGWDGLSADPRVADALGWLAMVANDLAGKAPHTGVQILGELRRLQRRASGLLRLAGPSTVTGRCPMCGQLSFVADVDRAVCSNTGCRDDFGGRRCWLWDTPSEQWLMVAEPTVSERGRKLRRGDLSLLEQVITSGAA